MEGPCHLVGLCSEASFSFQAGLGFLPEHAVSRWLPGVAGFGETCCTLLGKEPS